MEKYDLTRIVPWGTVTTMGLVVFWLTIILILAFLWIKHAYPNDNKGFFFGFLTYFLIRCVLVMVARGEIVAIDSINAAAVDEAQKNAILNLMQVVFIAVECAILVVMLFFAYTKMFFKDGNKSYGNVLVFAFGYAMVDSVSTIFRVGTNWVFANTINTAGLEKIVAGTEGKELDDFMKSIEFFFNEKPITYLMLFIERINFVIFAIILITMLYMVAKNIRSKKYVVAAWGIYVLYYLPGVLKFAKIISSDEVVIAISTVYIWCIAIFMRKIFIKDMPEEAEYLSGVRRKGIFRVIFSRKNKVVVGQKQGSISKSANINTNK